jgi:hypothetical protein
MNELELKDLFVSSLESGHLLDSKDYNLPFANDRNEIRIKNEGYFGKFDLVIAVIQRNNTISEPPEEIEDYNNILARTGQLVEVARNEKCLINEISFYPVELKSSKDTLDARLPNQIMDAILTFGRSLVVLDNKHINKTSLKFLRLLPATIITYTGRKDYFKVVSVFDRFIDNAMLNISKRRFAKTLLNKGIEGDTDKIYHRLSTLERINQKFVFNQIYDADAGFFREEIEFLRQFSNIDARMSYKKQVIKHIKESSIVKITDYL